MAKTSKLTLERLAANADGAFENARSMPPAMYHDLEIYDLELDRLFRREWICIGRLAEMPESGDYICCDIIDSPVFAVRQVDRSVKAFANVCLHRSASLLQGLLRRAEKPKSITYTEGVWHFLRQAECTPYIYRWCTCL